MLLEYSFTLLELFFISERGQINIRGRDSLLFTQEFRKDVEIAFITGGLSSAVDLIHANSKNSDLKEKCNDFKQKVADGKKQEAIDIALSLVRLAGLQEKEIRNLTDLKKYRKKLVTPEFLSTVKKLSTESKLKVVEYIDSVFVKDAGIRKLTGRYIDICEFGDKEEAEKLYSGILTCLGLTRYLKGGV